MSKTEESSSPVNPIAIRKVKKGEVITRSLSLFSFAPEAAPEDGILIREDRGQKTKGTSIYLRNSDLKKIKALAQREEIIVFPWEGVDNKD